MFEKKVKETFLMVSEGKHGIESFINPKIVEMYPQYKKQIIEFLKESIIQIDQKKEIKETVTDDLKEHILKLLEGQNGESENKPNGREPDNEGRLGNKRPRSKNGTKSGTDRKPE